MKHLLSVSILAAGLSLLAPTMHARNLAGPAPHQDAPKAQADRLCGFAGLPALRGTYALTGTAWQDLSVMDPSLPKGYAPVTLIGVFTVNAGGEVTGWALVNTGGLHLTAEFVNSRFEAPRADCGVPLSLSMKINEFGEGIAGPYPYMAVVSGEGQALEIALMMLGTGPGSHLESSRAKRISMHFD